MPQQALAQLRAADPRLAALIDALGTAPLQSPPDRPAPGAHYAALVRAIVGQQLSTKAARAIWARLLAQFDGRPPEPAEVLAADPQLLRAAAGLSQAKLRYLRSLAEHVVSGALDLPRISALADAEVIAELSAVSGIGIWTAQMFMMFQLQRPDVLPTGDLGIRRAIQITYELPELPAAARIEQIAEPWRPHRTLACRYLWRSLERPPEP